MLFCGNGLFDVVLDTAPGAFTTVAVLFGVATHARAIDVAIMGDLGLGGATGMVLLRVSSDCIGYMDIWIYEGVWFYMVLYGSMGVRGSNFFETCPMNWKFHVRYPSAYLTC